MYRVTEKSVSCGHPRDAFVCASALRYDVQGYEGVGDLRTPDGHYDCCVVIGFAVMWLGLS